MKVSYHTRTEALLRAVPQARLSCPWGFNLQTIFAATSTAAGHIGLKALRTEFHSRRSIYVLFWSFPSQLPGSTRLWYLIKFTMLCTYNPLKVSLKLYLSAWVGMVVYAFNPSTHQAEVGGSFYRSRIAWWGHHLCYVRKWNKKINFEYYQ